MTIINVSQNRLVQIGYEGEDKVTILRFSYSDKWLENGDGIFTVRVLRNGENKAYNAQMVDDDRENYTIDMTVTDVELSKKGYGEMQLVYTGADFVKKSSVYKYYVSRSIDEAVDPPEGDVYTQIIESLADLRVDFNELSDIVSEINDDIGDLAELTTANKLNIVESINEVNAKSFVSVDDELSDASTNPVQNKVITSRIISAESAIQGKANVQIVSALSDDVSDLQTDVQGLADAVDGIGNLAELTTEAKTDLVSAINEVNEHGGGSVTADSALSDTSENPVQNKTITRAIREVSSYARDLSGVIDGLGEDVEGLETAIQGKADIQTVSALSDAVNGLDTDVQGLQTAVQSKADTSTVTALSGTVSGLQTAVQSKADAQTVTTLSGAVTDLQTGKADKSYVDTQLVSKIGDVQVNGTSIVSDWIANVPIASSSNLGVSKCSPSFGINVRADGYLNVVSANSTAIKNGNATYLPVTTTGQHESVFYGLAKVAGHDEKNSTLPVGTYSEEAKTAIRTMLGIGTAIELREYSELGEDTELIEIPLPEKYEKVWYRFQCRINNADNNLSNGLTQYVAWLGDSSSFGSNEQNISIYNNIYIRSSDIFMIKGFFIVDFPFVERFSSEPYGATNWSAKSNLVTYDGSYMSMNRLTSYPRSLFIRPYETNKGYLFKANSMLGVYVK